MDMDIIGRQQSAFWIHDSVFLLHGSPLLDVYVTYAHHRTPASSLCNRTSLRLWVRHRPTTDSYAAPAHCLSCLRPRLPRVAPRRHRHELLDRLVLAPQLWSGKTGILHSTSDLKILFRRRSKTSRTPPPRSTSRPKTHPHRVFTRPRLDTKMSGCMMMRTISPTDGTNASAPAPRSPSSLLRRFSACPLRLSLPSGILVYRSSRHFLGADSVSSR